jgi:hypothetical protein
MGSAKPYRFHPEAWLEFEGAILGVNQAAVSKLERRTDMYVSTLQDFVRAMGGELKITARFPEGTVEISQFAAVKKAPGED